MAIVTRATSKIAHICKVAVLLAIFTGVRQGETAAGLLTPGFRPPAVPLAVVDPYFRYVLKCRRHDRKDQLDLVHAVIRGRVGVV